MSAYNNHPSRPNVMASSGMFFVKTTNSPHNNIPFQANHLVLNRQPTQISSLQSINPPPARNITTQSVIFAPRNEGRTQPPILNRLDSMARHVQNNKLDEFPSQKHNSSQKAPFNRSRFANNDKNSFPSQMAFPKSKSRLSDSQEEKTEGTELSQFPVKRKRESVDLDAMARTEGFNSERWKLFQRAPPFQPIVSNQNRIQEKNDCESTNSGSGNDLLKSKQFDFLKKKKETKEQKEDPQTFPQGQNFRNFNPLKKSQIVWPLSISPLEQKFPKKSQNQPHYSEQTSTNTDQGTLMDFTCSSLQFKKKKVGQSTSPSTPTSTQLNNRTEQQSRFNPLKHSTDLKGIQRKQEKSLYASGPLPVFKKRLTMRPPREITVDDFDIIHKLGKGAFGEVYVAQEKVLGLVCVLKKMSKKRIREAKIKLQSYLSHQHVTSLYGFFHDEDYLYLVLELLPDGSLQQVKKKKKLPERQTADMVRQVALGLKYMHQEFVIHRDLKPQNLFLNEKYVKIGDFGCSIYHNQSGLRNTIVGCLEYSSPQQLSKEGYTDKIDSWSLGIMTFELLFGKSPFESDIKKMVMSGDASKELSQVVFPTIPAISEEVKKFILNLLDRNPQHRMDMDEVLHHSFLRETQSN